jgi:hypothetical protein
MDAVKTKSIETIEQRMEHLDTGDMRYRVLQNAKAFKTSWIELGQSLYAVWKDKLYKEWGYNQFDTFTSREIGIRKKTALKLLKSYYFLEREEPQYLTEEHQRSADVGSVPTYEAVDALRQASKNKEIDKTDYVTIRKDVLERGKDVREVKKDLTALIKQREELQPEEARQKRRTAVLKRFVSLLRSVTEEAKVSKLLPVSVIKDADQLIGKLENEVRT